MIGRRARGGARTWFSAVTRLGRWTCCFVSLVVGCSRDLSVPEPLGDGELIGRVVVAVPGRGDRLPAADTLVQLSSSSLSTRAGADGRFRLVGITSSEGTVLFRYHSAETGTRLKRLSLADHGAGPGRVVNLGDVRVVESAALHGRALRGDLLEQKSGHLNSVVFVPEGPTTTYTGDDGSFALSELPEGPLQLSVFRDGYEPFTLSQLTLRSGEDFPLKDIVLLPAAGAPLAGSIAGSVRLLPQAPFVGTAVTATRLGGQGTRVDAATDGTFTVAGLQPGVYDVSVERPGYSTAFVPNVLVRSDQVTVLREVVLSDGASVDLDAGRELPRDAGPPDAGPPDAGPPDAGPPDAGPPDAGPPDAGPPDAGPPDAGAADAGARTCAMNLDCPMGQWCDDRLCVPQCASSGDCTHSRVCDLSTRTCIAPCDGGCSAGYGCDVAAGVCRLPCDAFSPCPPGLKCSAANRCVPQCSVAADCPAPHSTCHNGQCGPTGTCDSDLDCPLTQRCLGLPNGVCQPRSVGDGGTDAGPVFPCSAACDCRVGEACVRGACRFEGLPTVFVTADGGGLGGTPADPTSELRQAVTNAAPGTVIALRAGDVFTLDAGLTLSASRVTLAGGYVDCGGRGWLRDEAQLTQLSYTATPVLQVTGTSTASLESNAVRNLHLSTGFAVCGQAVLRSALTRNQEIENIRATIATACGSGGVVANTCSGCESVHMRDVVLTQPTITYGNQSSVQLLSMSGSSGLLEGLVMPTTSQAGVLGINMGSLRGPLTIRDYEYGGGTGSGHAFAIAFDNCLSHRLTLEDSRLRWPVGGSVPSGVTTLLDIKNCNDLVIRNNHIDGLTTVGITNPVARGVTLTNCSGSITGNHFDLPALDFTSTTGMVSVIQVNSTGGPLTIADNSFARGDTGGGTRLIELLGLTVGPVRVERNVVTPTAIAGNAAGATNISAGLFASGVQASAQLTVTDNVLHSIDLPNCVGIANGAYLLNTTAVLERNQLYGRRGNSAHGLTIEGGSTVELYSNYLYGGVSTARASPCSTTGTSTGLNLVADGGVPYVWAVSNTIEGAGEPSQVMPAIGVSIGSPLDNSVFVSNLIGGGRAPTHPMVQSASAGTTWSANYFWYAYPGQRTDGDSAPVIVADGGSNLLGDLLGCYDLSRPHPTYELAPAAPCVDTGSWGRRLDMSVVGTDLFGRPRDAGAGPDIGAWERH